MVVTWVADGVPAYVVKNEHIGKKEVLHRSRLLLWLTDFGEPMQMNRMYTSVTLLGQIPENPLSESEDGGPVLGSVQCGLNLAKLRIMVDTPESMTCQVAQEVRMGALRNGTGLRIELQVEEETDLECLGSFMEDIPCS